MKCLLIGFKLILAVLTGFPMFAPASAQELVGTTLYQSGSFDLGEDLGSGQRYRASLGDNFQAWGAQMVLKNDEFPVRLGEKSIRFETREGICGWDGTFWNDCVNGRNRHELSTSYNPDPSDKNLWYALSFYLPEDFSSPRKIGTTIFQLWSGGRDSWSFKYDTGRGFYMRRNLDFTDTELVPDLTAKGRWIDIVLRVRHSDQNSGSFVVWLDGKKVYDYTGRTTAGDDREAPNYFKFGIYNTALGINGAPVGSASHGNGQGLPSLILFFDEVRAARSCAGLNLSDLGYDCANFSYEGANRNEAQKLQSALNTLECNVGSVDGIIGRKTEEAAMTCRWFGQGQMPDTLSVSTLPRFVELYSEAVATDMPAAEHLIITKASSEIVGSNKDNALTLGAFFGDLQLDVILIGNFDAAGMTQWFSILFLDELDQLSEASVKNCSGGRTQHWGDGSIHAEIAFRGGTSVAWKLGNADCFDGALPSETAEELAFVIDNFQSIAETLAAEGYSGVHHDGLSRFIELAAAGEVTVGRL